MDRRFHCLICVGGTGGATGVVPFDPSLPEPHELQESEGGWGRAGNWVGKDVYEKEQLVRFRPGTMLLYRMDTYHRGSVVYENGLRR